MKPAPHKPAKRAPAVVRAGEVYSLAELRRRLGWQEHAVRQARIERLAAGGVRQGKVLLGFRRAEVL